MIGISKRLISSVVCVLMLCLVLLTGCGQRTAEVRIGALKGPTSMGLLYLMNDNIAKEDSHLSYYVEMAVSADELLPKMVKGELDIALVPANVASVLYAKTKGQISAIDINTLGVLYIVSATKTETIQDLKGKTIYLTGKGTTPDYVLSYLLKENGISEKDCVLEYKSEATEVAALLAENPEAVGLLPQPFVTAACAQNEQLQIQLDLNAEWNQVQGSQMVTGVTVVRKEFLEEQEETVKSFLEDHAKSVDAINQNPQTGAEYAEAAGIVGKKQIAQKAIPFCNLTCITGEEMKTAVSGYLEVLYQQNPESVGGSLPGDDFYFIAE